MTGLTKPISRKGIVLLAAAVAVALLVSPVDAHGRARHMTDPERDCEELVPETYSAAGISDSGQQVILDVMVLMDGVTPKRAADVMTRVAASYAPLRITVVSRYQKVELKDDGTIATAAGAVPTGHAERLIADSKALSSGVRPVGTDVVFTLTNKDIFDYTDSDGDHSPDESERDYDVVGLADCIGGIRYPEAAFAVGEDFRGEYQALGPLNTFVQATAKIAAHEIGHLLGAHHHYSDCVEGAASELGDREASPCTLMFGYIELASQNFGALEGLVVRGHAVRYALP